MPRTDAIVNILMASATPLGPSELAQRLAERGREDSAEAISASLEYLKNQTRVHRLGRGQWVLVNRHGHPAAEMSPPIEFQRFLDEEATERSG